MAENSENFKHNDYSAQRDKLEWQSDALCAQTDPELFFSNYAAQENRIIAAKKICANCIVARKCLNYALDNPRDEGVLGGMSAAERKKLKDAPLQKIESAFFATQALNRRLK